MTSHSKTPSLGALAMPPAYCTIAGTAVRYVDSGTRDAHHRHALLLSPWPESILAYEPAWAMLAQTAHLIAIDLPGFGRSESTDRFMSPRAMGEFIVQAADAFGLERPHVVGPDIGTAASLFAAAAHPARFASLVVGTGGAAVPIELGEPLRGWVYATDLEPYRQIDGRKVVERATSTLERYELGEAARADYLASYEGDRFAESMRYVQSYPAELPVLGDLLKTIRTPVQIIAGRRDTVVPPVNAEYLHARLPNSEMHLLDAGHFVWEDAASEYVALVRTWWARHHAS